MFSFVYVCSMYACRCHSALLSHCFPSPFLVFPTCFLVFVVLFRFLLLLLLSFFFIILIGGARGLRMTQIEKLQASIAEWQVTRSGKKSNEIQFIYIYICIYYCLARLRIADAAFCGCLAISIYYCCHIAASVVLDEFG